MSDLFDQLKQKYQPVLTTIQNEGAELHNVNLDGGQLYLKATAKSESSKNRIWDVWVPEILARSAAAGKTSSKFR